MGVCWRARERERASERASGKAAKSNGKVARGMGRGQSSQLYRTRAFPRDRQLCRLLGILLKTNHKMEWNYSAVRLIFYFPFNFIFRDFFQFYTRFIHWQNQC